MGTEIVGIKDGLTVAYCIADNLTMPLARTDQAACCALTDFARYFATIAMLWSWRYTAG